MGETTLKRLAGDDDGDRGLWVELSEQVDAAETLLGHGRLYVMRPLGNTGVFGAASGVAPNAYKELVMPQRVPPRMGHIAIDGTSPN